MKSQKYAGGLISIIWVGIRDITLKLFQRLSTGKTARRSISLEFHVANHSVDFEGSHITLHNVCAVQWRMFSTLRDIMSTTGDIMINVGEGLWENN